MYHEGSRCEIEIDVCQNETCSNNGKCVNLNNKPVCDCFSSYEGSKCELMSESLKSTKAFISMASIVAIIFIVFFYLFIIIMDVLKFSLIRIKISIKDLKWNAKNAKMTFNRNKPRLK